MQVYPSLAGTVEGPFRPVQQATSEWNHWELRNLNLHRVVSHWQPGFVPPDAATADATIRAEIRSRFRPNYLRGLAFGVVIKTPVLFLDHSVIETLVDATNSSKAVCQWVVLASAKQSQALGVHTWLETRLSPIYRSVLRTLTDAGFVCRSTVRSAPPALRSTFALSNLLSISRLLGGPGRYPPFENRF